MIFAFFTKGIEVESRVVSSSIHELTRISGNPGLAHTVYYIYPNFKMKAHFDNGSGEK